MTYADRNLEGMTSVSNLTAVINVPSCSHQTHSSDYSSVDASNFTPDHGDYYRGKLPVMLPGAIIGVLCLIAAFLFLVWVSEPSPSPYSDTKA